MIPFITADQLLAHAVGDYILQSDWMANEKTKRLTAGWAHACCYTLPFLFLTLNPMALWFICVTHFWIDHYRLARYICWGKNIVFAPSSEWQTWAECSATGYSPIKPAFLSIWLLIIADNTLHIICNGIALRWLA